MSGVGEEQEVAQSWSSTLRLGLRSQSPFRVSANASIHGTAIVPWVLSYGVAVLTLNKISSFYNKTLKMSRGKYVRAVGSFFGRRRFFVKEWRGGVMPKGVRAHLNGRATDKISPDARQKNSSRKQGIVPFCPVGETIPGR